jgi:hypothetical protein
MPDTLFVAGGSGFVGKPFVRFAVEQGYDVQAISRSKQTASLLSALGATPISGDLLVPGPWQETAAQATYVVQIAQPPTFGIGRIGYAVAERYRANRLAMDANLLGCLRPDVVRRVVYVSGTSYYGQQTGGLHDETATPNPRGWGPYIIDALEQLARFKQRLPIIEPAPGGVYGPGSWLELVLKTLQAGRAVIGTRGGEIMASSIHYEDCARAILYLLDHGAPGERYFLVDDRPAPTIEIVKRTADAMGVRLQTLLVPKFVVSLLLGPVFAEAMTYQSSLSNAKLKQTGFTLNFPTVAEGIPDVVQRWLAENPRRAELAR